jgi:DNA-binding transcriptional LysR family regulator
MLKTTLEQWRMFQAVVEHGGFNHAAQAVHKSQSSIHHAVQKLEDSLGVQLLEVIGRKTQLTAAGELMLRRGSYLLEEASKLESVALSLSEGTETQLKIAVDEIFPDHLLYAALEATSKEFPLLRIELMETVLSGGNELLDNSLVDLAVSAFPLVEGFNEELCQIEFIAVSHPDHELQNLDRELTLEDLKSYRQIVTRDSAAKRKEDSGWLSANQRWTVSHIRTSIDMISKGLGFAWLPVSSICEHLKTGRLKPLPLAHSNKRSVIMHLTFKDGDRLGPATRSFIGELRYQCMQLETAEDLLCS